MIGNTPPGERILLPRQFLHARACSRNHLIELFLDSWISAPFDKPSRPVLQQMLLDFSTDLLFLAGRLGADKLLLESVGGLRQAYRSLQVVPAVPQKPQVATVKFEDVDSDLAEGVTTLPQAGVT